MIGLAWIVVGITTILAFTIFLKRLRYDGEHKQVQYAVTFDDIDYLSQMSGNDPSTTIAILKSELGIQTVVVPEFTIASYEMLSKITILEGYDIINTLRVGQLYRTVLSQLQKETPIKPNATYIVVDEVAVYSRIITHLKLFLPPKSVREYSGRIIEVTMPKARLMGMPLGFDADLLDLVSMHSFNIIPEFKSYDMFSKEKLELMFAELRKNHLVTGVKFNKFFKFSDYRHLDEFVTIIRQTNLKLVFPEFSKFYYEQPDKLTYVATQLADQVAVSHQIDETDGPLSFRVMYDRFMRALNERSPQLLIFSVNMDQTVSNIFDKNILFMKKVIESYERLGGETVHVFQTYPQIRVTAQEKGILGIGIFSLLFVLICRVHRLNRLSQQLWLAVGLVGVYGTLVALVPQAFAIMGTIAAIIGPIIGMVYFYPTLSPKDSGHYGRKIRALAQYLGMVFAVCFLVIVHIVALYSDSVHLNNVQPFWGVKASLLVPVVLIAFYFYCGPLRVNSFRHVIRQLLQMPLTNRGLALFLLTNVIIVVYIFRSGNYLSVSALETLVRAQFQDMFIVRPRFKEFFVGYPALIFSVWFLNKRTASMAWLVNGLGAIALTSLINSFCHFHTPIIVSVYRSFWGLGIGIAVFMGLAGGMAVLQGIKQSMRSTRS